MHEQKVRHAAALLLALALVATPLAAKAAGDADADNTQRNARDRDGTSLSPMDQGNSESDRAITQQIRKQVVANDSLSMNAKNVKIITIDGVVTLRGPVKSPQEKAIIASAAARASGVKRVDDQIEVERNP